MGLDKWFNRKILRSVLIRRVNPLTWEQVLGGAFNLAERYGSLISGASEASAHIEGARGYSLLRETVDLAGLNFSVAAKIEAIRTGRPAPPLRKGTQLELEAKTLEDARQLHQLSTRNLITVCATPVTTMATAEHDQFGPLTAKQWLATSSYYHELVTLQVERLMRTPEYLNAQGKKW